MNGETLPSSTPDSSPDVLLALDPISLGEMDSHALMNRIDTKYVLSAGHLQTLLESVGTYYRVLSVDSVRLSTYNTLYFDTPDYECYLQHHNGKLNRRKIRIRQYQSSGACFLEVKAKNNKGRTKKQRIPIAGFEDSLSSSSKDFIEMVTGSRFDLTPQLQSSFSRITLVNRQQPERVTLDLGLEFRHRDERRDMPNIIIAEVKQEFDDLRSPMREYFRRLHIRPMRLSKYCLGTVLLKPHLKYNLFKSKLTAICKIA
ncbi:polyphosphate polymerase domain-containing protein [Bythopirellula polymerisocia]|uniref:VTC domain protein n=1 Tax=Bythopirellula polymerisocia TaxID=2528003 RepID=A0A5C6CXI0_9BACT|nr:polyphosphate polymerase domain-containing protein [Bythopirellula polymerisocia]TWU27736.1 VTC domain protein [Bythopirellula polymerisocia]